MKHSAPLFISLVVLVLSAKLVSAQNEFKLAGLSNGWNEKTYQHYLARAKGKGDSGRVSILQSLKGLELVRNHEYGEAERLLTACVRYVENGPRRGRNSIGYFTIFDCFDYLGRLYAAKGNDRRAEQFLLRAIQNKEKEFGPGSTTRILNTQSLAEYYLNRGLPGKAEKYYDDLIHHLRRVRYANKTIRSAYTSYYRGMTRISLGRHDNKKAAYFLDKAYEVFIHGDFTDLFTRVKPDLVDDELKILKARYLVAAGSYQLAISTIKSVDTKTNPDALRLKVECLVRLDRSEEALTESIKLIDLNLANIRSNFNYLSGDEKVAFMRPIENDLDLLASLALVAERKHITFDFDRLLELRLITKGLLLSNERVVKNAIAQGGPQATAMYARLKNFRDALSRRILSPPVLAFPRFVAETEAIRDSIDVLEKSLSSVTTQIAAQLDSNTRVSDIQRYLDANSSAVELIRFQNRFPGTNKFDSDSVQYLALVLRKAKFSHEFMPGSPLEGRLARIYKTIMRLGEKVDTLYRHFWEPLTNAIGNATVIYLSPDGIYNKINPNTLYDGSSYLIDTHNIYIVSNLREIMDPPAPLLANHGRAYFFARPDYSDTKANSSDTVKRAVTLENLREFKFADLIGTEQEVALAEKELGTLDWNRKVYLHADAREKSLKEVRNPDILHIGTHGFFLENNSSFNPMLESGLIFSGANAKSAGEEEDGILTAYEASELELDSTQLVVLSACETGLGEVRNGEGVYGLRRAFSIAGAHQIIISLWSVDDAATSQLMVLFYRNLVSTRSVRAAFMQAQKTLKETNPLPINWGGFILQGK